MKERKKINWFILSVILMAGLLASIVTGVVYYKKTVELTDNAAYNIEQEWYMLSRMGHYVDLYVNDSDVPYPDGVERCSLFVNQVCSNFTGGTISELSSAMRNWLTLSYAYIFADLSASEPVDTDLALQIVREMNQDLVSICGKVLDMDQNAKKKLLDSDSNEYKELLGIAKTAYQKYSDETDRYFRKRT